MLVIGTLLVFTGVSLVLIALRLARRGGQAEDDATGGPTPPAPPLPIPVYAPDDGEGRSGFMTPWLPLLDEHESRVKQLQRLLGTR